MKEYQFVSDSYRLFSALHRLSDSDHAWYNASQSQKYLLRQIKAIDFTLTGDLSARRMFQEKASLTTKDTQGRPIPAEEFDVPLLMLYGHVLYSGRSFAYAISTWECDIELGLEQDS